MKLPLTPAEKSFRGGQENFRFHKLVNLPENKSRTIKPIEPTPPFFTPADARDGRGFSVFLHVSLVIYIQ